MAISWIIITILVVVGIFTIRLNNFRHRTFVIFLVLLALFLYISINVVAVERDLDFKSAEGIFSAIKIYTGWLANGFQNAKSLTGKAVKMDWTSVNETFFEKSKKK